MSSLRGPIAGIDGILISTAIDETGDDMSDTQSTPQLNLAFRTLYFHVATPIALNLSVGCVPTPSRAFGPCVPISVLLHWSDMPRLGGCMPYGDEPRVLSVAFLLGPALTVRKEGYSNGFQSIRSNLLDLNVSENCRCYPGHSGVIFCGIPCTNTSALSRVREIRIGTRLVQKSSRSPFAHKPERRALQRSAA